MTPVDPQILAALTHGISSEIAAYVFYIEASKKPEAADFKSMLEELALEEKKHFQILERQHSSLIRSEQWISLADVLKGEGLPEINEEMTYDQKELIEEVRKAGTGLQILDIAYRLEEEAYTTFDRQAKLTDSPEAKNMFNELAKFEAGHMRLIARMREEHAG